MHALRNRFPSSHCFVVGLALTTALSSAAWAGTEVQLTTTVQVEGESQTADGKIKMQDGNLWLDLGLGPAGQGSQSASIYRSDNKHLIVVDHAKESYSVMDDKAIGMIVDEMMSAMLEIDQQMGRLPVEQRKVLQDAWKTDRQRQSLKDRLVKTAEVATINGFSTRKFDVFKGEAKVREVWVTDWSQLPDGDTARHAMQGLDDFFKDMKAAFDSVSFASLGGARPFDLGESPFQSVAEMNGFPVRIRTYQEGVLVSETVADSAKKVDLPKDTFEPPKSYRQRTMKGE